MRTREAQLALCLLVAAGCDRNRAARVQDQGSSGAPAEPARAGAPAPGEVGAADRGAAGAPTHTEMRNVSLRVLEGASLHIRHLSGEAVSARSGQPIVLDDKRSYVIHIQSAEAVVAYPDLSRIMNEYTFAYDGASVKSLEVSREEDEDEADEIQLKGRLKKALGVPFEIEGRPEVTADGKIRIRTTSIQALDIKVGGLMRALGLKPGDVLGNLEQRGVRFEGNDMILDPVRAFPPPRVTGRVTSVRVEAKGLVLAFGAPTEPTKTSEAGNSNYLWFRRGTIRIGKMTQRDADLWIVDGDVRDPLDFYADHPFRQLVAGYAKLSPDGGLTMFVPDYEDIQ